MTAALLPWPLAKFFQPNTNLPLAGGKVYTYAAGTSTPLATYSDAAGTIPNANPVILDANGQANIYLGAGLSYKINLLDASNVQVPDYPIDNIIGADNSNAAQTLINALIASLASTTDAAKGAGQIGWSSLLSYAAGTVGYIANLLFASYREKLTGNRTYYVRTNGSNSNDGLTNSAGGAFLTIQHAVDIAYNAIDFNGHDVTIQVADGTYTGGTIVAGKYLGEGNLYIFGNTGTPSNCLISVTGADCFRAEKGAAFTLRGFRVTTTSSGIGVVAYTSGFISMQSMDFGAVVGAHIEAGTCGQVLPDGNYTITGNADSHWHVGSEGMIACGTITITNNSVPTFTSYFAGCAEGSISCGSVTFTSRSATGPFYLAHKNGVIDIGANDQASFLPGSVTGSCNTGGIIATTNRNWTPVLTFATPGDLNVVYSEQKGTWSRVGDYTYYTCDLVTSTFTHTTSSGLLTVSGIPFNSKNVANVNHLGSLYFQGVTKAGYTQFGVQLPANATSFSFPTFGTAATVSSIGSADMPTGGNVVIRFSILVLSATAD